MEAKEAKADFMLGWSCRLVDILGEHEEDCTSTTMRICNMKEPKVTVCQGSGMNDKSPSTDRIIVAFSSLDHIPSHPTLLEPLAPYVTSSSHS